MKPVANIYPETPDGRYFVANGRLWRKSNPALTPERRAELLAELMEARRAVATAKRISGTEDERKARRRVDVAKQALGERGPVWWTDGSPDLNRQMALNTPYADWYKSIE